MRRILWVLAVNVIFAGAARAGLVTSFDSNAVACNPDGTTCNSVSADPNPDITVVSPDHFFGIAGTYGSASLVNGSLTLHVSSSAGANSVAGIDGGAGFSDSVTLSGGTGTGQLSYTVGTNAIVGYGKINEPVSYSLGTPEVPATFTFGQPFTIGLSVSASSAVEPGGATSVDVTYSFASLSVVDGSGDPISGYSFTDDSGALYPFVGGTYLPPAPEPSSLVLGALACILGFCRVRQIRRHPVAR